MTNKKQLRRKLAWKYFRRQKWDEIKDFWSSDDGIAILVLTFVAGLGMQLFWMVNEKTGLPACKTAAIIGLFILGIWVLVGLIALIVCITNWIRGNWKQALEKADKQFGK